uniref:Serine racemase n=1 Tax=Parastrongyloides trichosuri TaxID=131310 RepID=A0A0N4ZPR1_PARTI
MSSISLKDILEANERIKGSIKRTPVLNNDYINKLIDKKVYFKCENFQETGSFKSRGALNAVRKSIEKNGNCQGFITHSSGNHGTALSWAAMMENKKCIVVVPENAPSEKKKMIERYNAEIILCKSTMKDRERCCEDIKNISGYKMIDPHNEYDVMAGQGSIGIEIDEEVPNCDAVLVAVGGGGLVSGVATYFKESNKSVKIYCVEVIGKNLQESVDAKERLWDEDCQLLDTIADGIRVIKVGDKCFSPLLKYCEKEILTVTDDEIKNAMTMIYEELKIVIEPTGAVTLAALLKYKDTVLKDLKNVSLIVCGGNISTSDIANIFK